MTRPLFALAPLPLLLALACAHKARGPLPTVETGEKLPEMAAPNPVQDEMRALTAVLQQAVEAVGLGDVSEIAHELHALHDKKEATEEAVKSGAYVLPKNPEQVDAFLAMDDAFHEQLEAMYKASKANDIDGMAVAIGTTLRSCNGCHTLFRP